MVTIVEQIEAIKQAEEQLTGQEQEIESARAGFLQQTEQQATTIARQITLAETFGAGAVGTFLGEERKAFAKAREKTLPKFTQAQQQIALGREQISTAKLEVTKAQERTEVAKIAQAKQARFQEILSRIARGRPVPPGTTQAEKARAEKILAPFRSRSVAEFELKETIASFKSAGLTPVFKAGEVVGFSDIQGKIDIPISQLGKIEVERLIPLEKAGVIEFAKIPQEQQFSLGAFEKPTEVDKTFFQKATGFLLGEIGISPEVKVLTPIGTPSVTFAQTKTLLREVRIPEKERVGKVLTEFTTPTIPGLFDPTKKVREEAVGVGLLGTELGVQVGAEFFPGTPLETGVTIATPLAFGKLAITLPRIAKVVFTTGAILEVKRGLDPGLTIEERATAFVGAGLFAGGAAFTKTKFQLGIKEQKLQIGTLLEQEKISPQTAEALFSGIKLQKFLRRAEDLPVIKSPVEAFPGGLTLAEQEAFARVALEGRIFGSQATRLRGLQKPGGDIDVAFKENIKVISEFQQELGLVSKRQIVRTREAIGFPGEEKFFDIKSLERIESFPFAQKGVSTPEGGEITKLSEQFSRKLSGALELRKGGKDLPGAVVSARGLIGREAARIEGIQFPPFKAFEQFKLARAERRLSQFEKALPEFEALITRAGGEPEFVPGIFVPSTEFPKVIDILPPGKRGQFDFIPSKTRGVELDPIIKLKPRVKLDIKIKEGIEIEPSGIKLPKIKPSRFKPSGFEPSRFKPKIFFPSITPKIVPTKEPSVFVTRLKPSESFFRVSSRIPGIPKPDILVLGTTFEFIRPELELDFRERKPKKGRRRKSEDRKRKPQLLKKPKKRITPIAPSFTSIVAELTGGLPKQIKGLGILPTKLRRLTKRKKLTDL